jgi:histone acetyltransferase (RNA polymerase elongator complex component)
LSKKRLNHLIVPVFIPNQGCPHRCIFCEQEKITSQPGKPLKKTDIENILDQAVGSKNFDIRQDPEIAFYGGTFTRLPIDQMIEYLAAASRYLKNGLFRSVRVSTRPDAMDEKRLRIMKAYGVRTVELGAQSLDDHVLSLSRRGHSAEDTDRAIGILRKHGFRVGIQLMPGLPGDSKERFRSTITRAIALRPDMVRLYPALVIRGTELAQWYREGRYCPMILDEALETCIESCTRLEAEGIPVIRIGLMSSDSLLEEGQILGGPWHPAFGFLVRSGIYHKRIGPKLLRLGEVSEIKIRAPKKDISLLRGYKNQGLRCIQAKTSAKTVRIEPDDSVPPGELKVDGL